MHKRLVQFSRTFGPRKALLCTKIDVRHIHTNICSKLISQEMPLNARANNLAPTTEALEHYNKLSRALTITSAEKTRLTKSLKGTKGKAKKVTQGHINKLG